MMLYLGQPTANFENFEIHLYFVSQPAVRPGCARCRAPKISHDKGNGVWGAVCLKTTKLDCLVNIDDVY